MKEKTCKIGRGLTDDYYAVTKFFKDGCTTDDRYKYKIENWDFVQGCVLREILVPLNVSPELWSKFINGKAKIVEE
jgi:hypothetical protein